MYVTHFFIRFRTRVRVRVEQPILYNVPLSIFGFDGDKERSDVPQFNYRFKNYHTWGGYNVDAWFINSAAMSSLWLAHLLS